MKKLIYQWPDPTAPNSAGAAYWPGQGNIEFDNPMDASFNTPMEYTNPKTKQKEKPNWFNISTLHELGHSVDDRFGLMKTNGAKPHAGGWQTHNVDDVADKLIAHFLKVDEMKALGVTQQRLHALTVNALRGTVAQPPDISPDAWKKLSDFVNTCAGRESSKKPWEHPLDVGGRSYHMGYSAAEGGEQWFSFAMASLSGFMSKYQWRAPAEWFAETYAFTWLKSVEAPGWVDPALAAYMYGGKVAAGAPQANKH
jgi:hypothetical protein